MNKKIRFLAGILFQTVSLFIIANSVETHTITWKGQPGVVYDVFYANSIAGTYTDVANVTATGEIVSWTDDGTQTPSHPEFVSQRYYRVREQGGTTFSHMEGKFTITLQGFTLNLVSIPFAPYNTAIGAVLGTQLIGDSSELKADRIWKWIPSTKTYQIAWLVNGGSNDGLWWDSSIDQESKITLSADEGFWIQNRHGTQKITFSGQASNTPNRSISLVRGMQLIGSAYPLEIPLFDTGLWKGGATGAINELDADRVWAWDPVTQKYQFAWLIEGMGSSHDGKWWDSSTGSETIMKLKPGVGYWFELRDLPGHADFTWTYPQPYTQPPN
ncbi:hypothetical protein IIA15_06420 [candidate division TA06 bacterium]|nr:hypothetical protein [candidate division TA06 bacterium]